MVFGSQVGLGLQVTELWQRWQFNPRGGSAPGAREQGKSKAEGRILRSSACKCYEKEEEVTWGKAKQDFLRGIQLGRLESRTQTPALKSTAPCESPQAGITIIPCD